MDRDKTLSAYYIKHKDEGQWIVIDDPDLIVDIDCVIKVGNKKFLRVRIKE